MWLSNTSTIVINLSRVKGCESVCEKKSGKGGQIIWNACLKSLRAFQCIKSRKMGFCEEIKKKSEITWLKSGTLTSLRVLHKFLSPLAHLGTSSTNLIQNTCLNDIFTCPQKKKNYLWYWKLYVHNTHLPCPIWATVIPWSLKMLARIWLLLALLVQWQSGKWFLIIICSTLPISTHKLQTRPMKASVSISPYWRTLHL